MASHSVFSDIEFYHGRLNALTIVQLNDLIRMLNTQMGINIRTTQAKKADIVLRITSQLEWWKGRGDAASYQTFARLFTHHKAEIAGTKIRHREGYQPAPPASAPYKPPVASSSAAPRYGAPAAALNSWDARAGRVVAAAAYVPPPRGFRWRESPLVTVVQSISPMLLLPASGSASDRKSATHNLVLNEDVRRKIVDSLANPDRSPQYALRVYCTPQTFYNPQSGAIGEGVTGGLPVEFPPTSEIRVNHSQIAASLKGVKKKLGSCPPANLHKAKNAHERMIDLQPGGRSSVELVHINQNQNATHNVKLNYYFQICLAQSLSPADLVKKVHDSRHRTAAEVVTEITKHKDNQDEEDDIEVGALTLGLKCPLSYIRMSNPMRSTLCNHVQCFDAASWFQINEQTPTWTCPVCEQALKVEHLFIDDFTKTIIKTVPTSVDEVIVEPNAQWHTVDKKHGDPSWLAMNSVPVSAAVSLRSSPVGDVKGKGKAEDVEVFVLDSDDEDGDDIPLAAVLPRLHQEAPSSSRAETPVLFANTSAEPIDLTLSSDDEDEAPPPPPAPRRESLAVPGAAAGIKRSATEEVSADIDKRPRYDSGARSNEGSEYDSHSPAQAYQQAPPPLRPAQGTSTYSAPSSRPGSAAGASTSAARPSYSYAPPPPQPNGTGSSSLASALYDRPSAGVYYPPPPGSPPPRPPPLAGDRHAINPDLRPAPTYRDAPAYDGRDAYSYR